ncbi:hypothetical protein SAMN05444920_113267 [Nonomuraea solani]|uniref:Uncharacterized protein n=1 Tax=Nonomuraea solani TaxID=1144553 RepID=A0A1H6ERG3_9ACTN|nr:hypothetical protein SAMN05444920_113267 [Nonomuraea solani]
MIRFMCHDDGAECWFAGIDDQECGGRFGRYLFEEAFSSGAAVRAVPSGPRPS